MIMGRKEQIEFRKSRINEMSRHTPKSERVVRVIGGAEETGKQMHTTFAKRLNLLTWCETATKEQVEQKRKEIFDSMISDDVKESIGGVVSGLPWEEVEKITMYEELGFVLGGWDDKPQPPRMFVNIAR